MDNFSGVFIEGTNFCSGTGSGQPFALMGNGYLNLKASYRNLSYKENEKKKFF